MKQGELDDETAFITLSRMESKTIETGSRSRSREAAARLIPSPRPSRQLLTLNLPIDRSIKCLSACAGEEPAMIPSGSLEGSTLSIASRILSRLSFMKRDTKRMFCGVWAVGGRHIAVGRLNNI